MADDTLRQQYLVLHMLNGEQSTMTRDELRRAVVEASAATFKDSKYVDTPLPFNRAVDQAIRADLVEPASPSTIKITDNGKVVHDFRARMIK
ncbi:hypothetical protein [Neorhizobium sp. T6_25]|uniref:hypothetical protein n=1 Tax=Neorhizobium sp. T6_25 TaxID=2093833 RepID=UPI000CF8BFDD|nr:hypothetical protein [Neorhizobium sp. T6_25]